VLIFVYANKNKGAKLEVCVVGNACDESEVVKRKGSLDNQTNRVTGLLTVPSQPVLDSSSASFLLFLFSFIHI